MDRHFAALCILLLLPTFSRISHAADDIYTFNYQAKLSTATGDPLEGAHTFYFRIIQGGTAEDPLSGDIVYAESASVELSDGIVNYAVGSGTPTTGTLSANLFYVGNLFHLQVAVDTETNVVLPRTAIQSVPMALRADFAQRAPWTGLVGIPVDLYDGASISNVVTVAKAGAHYSSIALALDSITDASAANPYLVKVGPGIYDDRITMKPYIDIEGSGELNTTITAAAGILPQDPILRGADHCEMRSISVLANGSIDYAIAIQTDGTSTRFRNVTALATGGTNWNYAFLIRNGGRPDLQNVTAVAHSDTGSQGAAVAIQSASAHIDASRAHASGNNCYAVSLSTCNNVAILNSTLEASSAASAATGFFCEGSFADLVNCSIRANASTISHGIYAASNPITFAFAGVQVSNCLLSAQTATCVVTPGSSIRLANTKLDGGPVVAGGTMICTHCYDENHTPNTYPTCP